MRDGKMCWREERVTTDVHVDMMYTEYQRYEIWSINQTQVNYYDFVTGMGGVTVDAAIDIPAAIGGYEAAEAAGVAAAEGAAVSAGAARLAIASKAMGTVGLTYLMFQVFTGAWVAYSGGTKNAAGDMLSEGWDFIRHYVADGYDENPVDSWEAIEEPHPCSDPEKTETGYIPSGWREYVEQGVRSGKVRVFTVLLCTGVIIGLAGPLLTDDDQVALVATGSVTATATTSATAAATTSAAATGTPARVAIDATAPAGMIVIFRLDGVDYLTNGLIHMGPHAPNCTYEHVHGGSIRSLVPGGNGQLHHAIGAPRRLRLRTAELLPRPRSPLARQRRDAGRRCCCDASERSL